MSRILTVHLEIIKPNHSPIKSNYYPDVLQMFHQCLILWLKELIKFSFYLIFLYYVPIAYLKYKFKGWSWTFGSALFLTIRTDCCYTWKGMPDWPRCCVLLAASITVSNKSLPKYLYRVFCDKRYKDLKVKLKMYSLLHRIDYQFIYFLSYNMFEFTKIAFYQYMIAVVTYYIAVNKIVDNFKWNFYILRDWFDLFALVICTSECSRPNVLNRWLFFEQILQALSINCGQWLTETKVNILDY